MSIYNIVLFVHVIGAIGYFLGMGILLFILLGLRRAQRVEQVRALIQLNDLSGPVSGISVLLLLAAGLYLAITAWSLLTSCQDFAQKDPGFTLAQEELCVA